MYVRTLNSETINSLTFSRSFIILKVVIFIFYLCFLYLFSNIALYFYTYEYFTGIKILNSCSIEQEV